MSKTPEKPAENFNLWVKRLAERWKYFQAEMRHHAKIRTHVPWDLGHGTEYCTDHVTGPTKWPCPEYLAEQARWIREAATYPEWAGYLPGFRLTK